MHVHRRPGLSFPARPPAGHHGRRHGHHGGRAYADHETFLSRSTAESGSTGGGDVRQLAQQDYERLLAFRTGLRRFLHWSQAQAREVGLTPAQHQLLLAVKGHPGVEGPTVGDLASYLLLRHHSAVELVDRAEAAQLVERWGDDNDGRLTRVRLTSDGEKRLNRLAPAHLDELQHLASVLGQLATEWNSPGHD